MADIDKESGQEKSNKNGYNKRIALYSSIAILILSLIGIAAHFMNRTGRRKGESGVPPTSNGSAASYQSDTFFCHSIMPNKNMIVSRLKAGTSTYENIEIDGLSSVGFIDSPYYEIGQKSETLCMVGNTETLILAYTIDLKTKSAKQVLNLPYDKSAGVMASFTPDCETISYKEERHGRKILVKSLKTGSIETFTTGPNVRCMFFENEGKAFELMETKTDSCVMNELLKDQKYKRKRIFETKNMTDFECSIQISHDYNTFMYSTRNNDSNVYNVPTKSTTTVSKLNALSHLSPDGTKIAYFEDDPVNNFTKLEIIDAQSGSEIQTINFKEIVQFNQWSDDGKYIFIECTDERLVKKVTIDDGSVESLKDANGNELALQN